MTLVGTVDRPALITHGGSDDHTEALQSYSAQAIAWLRDQKICGFIFKARSPSCGLGDAAVYDQPMWKDPTPSAMTDGLFARAVREAFPGLPVASEDQLESAEQRLDFIRRAQQYSVGRGD
jgi:uncharacterized protein YbbK (DUF523 family)